MLNVTKQWVHEGGGRTEADPEKGSEVDAYERDWFEVVKEKDVRKNLREVVAQQYDSTG